MFQYLYDHKAISRKGFLTWLDGKHEASATKDLIPSVSKWIKSLPEDDQQDVDEEYDEEEGGYEDDEEEYEDDE